MVALEYLAIQYLQSPLFEFSSFTSLMVFLVEMNTILVDLAIIEQGVRQKRGHSIKMQAQTEEESIKLMLFLLLKGWRDCGC